MFSIAVIIAGFVMSLTSLSLGRVIPIEVELSRVAVDTRVIKLCSRGILDPSGVEAFDVLPGIALLAVYGVAVVVGIVADALDSVRLFIDRLGDGRERIVRRGRPRRVRGRLVQRRALR